MKSIHVSKFSKFIPSVSKMPCGRTTVIKGFGVVRAYKTSRGRRFSVSTTKFGECCMWPAGNYKVGDVVRALAVC